jgi:hypothetical protein
MTVTFKTKNPSDMFHLIYTNIYDKAPPTITQKAGDIIGITFDFLINRDILIKISF